MPIHLPAQSRRQFLLTVGAGLVACRATDDKHPWNGQTKTLAWRS
jgi:hypothetical protein